MIKIAVFSFIPFLVFTMTACQGGEKAYKYDPRIKIINNNKNMGALYSRSIAALMSKGEYIFGLDNDDMYFYYDVFDYIYLKGKIENLDII